MSLPSNPTWTFIGPSGGGHFTSLMADLGMANKYWACTDYSGVFVSTDSGDNWAFSNTGLQNVSGTCFAQGVSNTSIMYHQTGKDSAGSGGIYSSTDNGVSWTQHASGGNYQATLAMHKSLAVKRDDANTAYMANAAGDIYRTTNRTTWASWKTAAQVGIGKIVAMAVDITNTYLWVGSTTGLRRITIADGTVTSYTLTGTNATVNADIIACTIAGTNYVFVVAGDRIAYSTSNSFTSPSYTAVNGLTSSLKITRMAIGVGASLGATNIITYSDQNSNQDAPNGVGNRMKSSNGGSTWSSGQGTDIPNVADTPSKSWFWGNPSYDPFCSSLIVDPNNSSRFFKSNSWEISRTDNFGVDWAGKSKGVGIQFSDDIRVAPDGSIYGCAQDNGVARSTDGGVSWKQLMPNSSQKGTPYDGHTWRVAFLGSASDWNSSLGVAIVSSHPWVANGTNRNQIFRSANQGGAQSNSGTWTVINSGGIPSVAMTSGIYSNYGTSRLIALAVDPNSTSRTTGRVWAGVDGYTGTTYGGTFLSTDAGVTWTRKTPTVTPAKWAHNGGLAVNPTDSNNIIYATWGSLEGIQVTTDGGSNWAESSTTGIDYCTDICFGTDGTAYASGAGGSGIIVYRSTNKGSTWSQIFTTTGTRARAIKVDPNSNDRLCVSAESEAGIAPQKFFISENCRAGSPTFTDVSGNLPQSQGFYAADWYSTGGVTTKLYAAGFGSGNWSLSLTSTTGSLTSVSVTPVSLVKATNTSHSVAFTTATTIPLDGKIEITYPTTLGTGFTINSGGTTAVTGASGLDGNFSIAVSGASSNILTITRSGGTASTSGVKSFTLTNIKNPTVSGSTGTYAIRTLDSTDAALDTGTASASTITEGGSGYKTILISGPITISGNITIL